jgi:hypothetical protein
MKKITACLTVIVLVTLSFRKVEPVKIQELKVPAPFGVITIKVPDFSKCKRLDITDFGAVQGNQEKTSRAIARAIEEANKIGGGVVVVPQESGLQEKFTLEVM